MPDPARRPALARLQLRRVAVTKPTATWPAGAEAWSRGLWGVFMPERRVRNDGPPDGRERRR